MAEAANNQSPFNTVVKTQTSAAISMVGTSAHAEVPALARFGGDQGLIAPVKAAEALTFLGTKPKIIEMTLDEKFACLKQCLTLGYGLRKVMCEVFEAIRSEVKTYKKNRAGMPTVEEAFKRRGLDYKTIHSQIEREKKRRYEDAQFFAELKKIGSSNNGVLGTTTDDLLPIGTKVIEDTGRRGVIIAHNVTDLGKSTEIMYGDDGTTGTKAPDNIFSLANFKAGKEAARSTAKRGRPEPKSTAAVTLTRGEHHSSNASPVVVPDFARGDERKLFNFLLSLKTPDGRPVIQCVFGGLGEAYPKTLQTFCQRFCDLECQATYRVAVTDRLPEDEAQNTSLARLAEPTKQHSMTIGDTSAPTGHGFFYEFRKHPSRPYAVRDMSHPDRGILYECKNKADAELKVSIYEREAAAATGGK